MIDAFAMRIAFPQTFVRAGYAIDGVNSVFFIGMLIISGVKAFSVTKDVYSGTCCHAGFLSIFIKCAFLGFGRAMIGFKGILILFPAFS